MSSDPKVHPPKKPVIDIGKVLEAEREFQKAPVPPYPGTHEPPPLTPEPPSAKEIVREFTRQLERVEGYKVMRDERRHLGDLTEPDNDPLLAAMRLVNLIAERLLLVEQALAQLRPNAGSSARISPKAETWGEYADRYSKGLTLADRHKPSRPRMFVQASDGTAMHAELKAAEAKLGLAADGSLDATMPVIDPDALFDKAFDMLAGMRKLDDTDEHYKPAFSDIELMYLSKRLKQSENMICDHDGKFRPAGLIVKDGADLADFVQRLAGMMMLVQPATRDRMVERLKELIDAEADVGRFVSEPMK